jgi:hypothetical protein
MQPATDIRNLEEVMHHLRQARLLAAVLHARADDLDSLLSVAESEAKRVYMAAVNAQPGTVPVILSDDTAEGSEPSR